MASSISCTTLTRRFSILLGQRPRHTGCGGSPRMSRTFSTLQVTPAGSVEGRSVLVHSPRASHVSSAQRSPSAHTSGPPGRHRALVVADRVVDVVVVAELVVDVG